MNSERPPSIHFPPPSPDHADSSYRLMRANVKDCNTPREYASSSFPSGTHSHSPSQRYPLLESEPIGEEQCPVPPQYHPHNFEVRPPQIELDSPHVHPLCPDDKSFLPSLEPQDQDRQRHLPLAYPHESIRIDHAPVQKGSCRLMMRSFGEQTEGNGSREFSGNNHSTNVDTNGNNPTDYINDSIISHSSSTHATSHGHRRNYNGACMSSNNGSNSSNNSSNSSSNSSNSSSGSSSDGRWEYTNAPIAHEGVSSSASVNLNDNQDYSYPTRLTQQRRMGPPLYSSIYPTLQPPPPPIKDVPPPPPNVIRVPVVQQTIHRNRYIDVPEIHIKEIIQPVVKVEEICKEVLVDDYVYTEKIVELSKDVIVDKCVEKVEVQEKIVNVNKDVYEERIIEVPKYEYETIEKYIEVPTINIIDKYVEVPEYVDKIVYKDKVKVIEIPVETIKTVPRINVQYVEKIREVQDNNNVDFIDVPVQRIVHNKIVNVIHKIIEVPEYETIEVERPVEVEVPGDVVEIPYDVPVYVDEPEYKQVPGKVIQVFKEKVYEKTLEKPVPVPSIEYKVEREPVKVPVEVFKHVDIPRYVDQLVEVPKYVPYLLPATILQPYNVQEVVEADPIYEEGTPRYIYDQSQYVPPIFSDPEAMRLINSGKHCNDDIHPKMPPNIHLHTNPSTHKCDNSNVQSSNDNISHYSKPNSYVNNLHNFMTLSPSYRPPPNMSPPASPLFYGNPHSTFPKNLPTPAPHGLASSHALQMNAMAPRREGRIGQSGNWSHCNSSVR